MKGRRPRRKRAVFGARTRPDEYPNALYRVPLHEEDPIQQYVHGHWFPLYSAAGHEPVKKDWLDEECEKGLVWPLEAGVAGGDDQPAWLESLRLRVALTEGQLSGIVKEDWPAWGSHIPAASLSTCKQTGRWFSVQTATLSLSRGPWQRVLGPAKSYYTRNPEAAEKWFYQQTNALDTQGKVIVSVDTTSGDWFDRLKMACVSKLRGVEQEALRRAAELAETKERHLARCAARLVALNAKPIVSLTRDEYQEKMRLKRELSHVSS